MTKSLLRVTVVLVGEDDEQGEPIGEWEENTYINEDSILEQAHEMTELSLSSMVGLSSSKIMKIRGLIGEHEVLVLLDSGATHNFISVKLIDELRLPLDITFFCIV